ncbi:MAG: hypothetical protein WC900_04370 [Oscillospiraceae bacterium]|jgi:hypothetical protein
MGKVIPLANALNISQEELWGTMATFTGVIGNTAEDLTQFRGVLAGLAAPTESMGDALMGIADGLIKDGRLQGDITKKYQATRKELTSLTKNYNVLNKKKESGIKLTEDENKQMKIMKSGIKSLTDELVEYQGGLSSAIINTIGFPELLAQIGESAQGNTGMLKEMFGRIEATTLALAAGELKETWLEKTAAMYESAGASADAYLVHAESIYHSFEQFKSAAEVAKISVGGFFATLTQPLVQTFTIQLADMASGMRKATEKFVEWREELQSKGSFQEKLEFTLDAIVNVGKTVLQAAGGAIDDFADYLRTEVLGEAADTNEGLDLGDISAVLRAGITVVKGVVTWFGKQVDNKADAIRAELGLDADDNEGTDIGDIRVIASATFAGFNNDVGSFAETMKNEAVNLFTGAYPDGIDLGEQQAKATAIINIGKPIMDVASMAAAVVFAKEALNGISKSLTGHTVTIPKIFLAVGAWEFGWNMGSILGDSLVEEMNKENYLQKAFELVEEQLGKQVLSPEEMAETGLWADVKNSIKVWFRIGVAEIRDGFDEVIEEKREDFTDVQKEVYNAIMNDPFDKTAEAGGGGGAFGTESGFSKFIEITKLEIAEIGAKVMQGFDDAKADLALAGQQFMDFWTPFWDALIPTEEGENPLKKFGEQFSENISWLVDTMFGDQTKKLQEAINNFQTEWNGLVNAYNESIAGTGLPELVAIDMKVEPKLADDFDSQLDADLKNIIGDTSTGTEYQYTINFETNVEDLTELDKYPTGSITYIPGVLPLSEDQKNPKGNITYEPVKSSAFGDFVSGIFGDAQSKIDNLKTAISGIFEGADTKKTAIDSEIDGLQQKIDAASKDADRLDNIGEQARKNIETLEGKISALTSESKLIDIGVNIAQGGYETLQNFGVLINGVDRVVTSVINAIVNGKEDVEKAEKTFDSLADRNQFAYMNVEANGVEQLYTVQDELGLIPPESNTTVTAIDNASGTIDKIQGMTIDDKFFNIIGLRKEEAGSGSGGGGGGSFNDDDFTPHNGAFALGGYTAPVGRSTPAGIVHGGEWVAPAWMVEDSKFSRAIESLEESRRTRGYASGGTVMPQQNLQPTINFTFHVDQFVGTEEEAGNRIGEIAYTKLKEQGYV